MIDGIIKKSFALPRLLIYPIKLSNSFQCLQNWKELESFFFQQGVFTDSPGLVQQQTITRALREHEVGIN